MLTKLLNVMCHDLNGLVRYTYTTCTLMLWCLQTRPPVKMGQVFLHVSRPSILQTVVMRNSIINA